MKSDPLRLAIFGANWAGLDGLAINFADYLKELPYFAAEVLPRLERLRLRVTAA
jgi:hypothetical protein